MSCLRSATRSGKPPSVHLGKLRLLPLKRDGISQCGESNNLGEIGAGVSVVCRRFLLPSHPR
jgi:hypothetical protein